jgi:hypothetical protein
VKAAISQLQAIYKTLFFPEMKADWSAYPGNIGHTSAFTQRGRKAIGCRTTAFANPVTTVDPNALKDSRLAGMEQGALAPEGRLE